MHRLHLKVRNLPIRDLRTHLQHLSSFSAGIALCLFLGISVPQILVCPVCEVDHELLYTTWRFAVVLPTRPV